MSFNPDPSKEAQEIIFSRKLQKIIHPSIYFNNNPIDQTLSQKRLEMILNTKLNFQEHIKNIPTKVNKTIGLLPKLPKICPQEHYLRYLNRLSGLILITVMLYMTRVIIIFFIRKWIRYNITQH